MVKLSIVIPARNQETPIGRAIQQFWTPIGNSAVEVIVADAGSQDGTKSVARLLADEIVDVKNEMDDWKPAAKNAGAAAAHGDIILFVEPETRMLTELAPLMERFQKLFGNGRKIVGAVTLADANGQTNGLLAVQRKAFLECGGFDESIDHDTNLMDRLTKFGRIEALQELRFSMVPPAPPESEEVAA
jgi:glycosyl transferase family 2